MTTYTDEKLKRALAKMLPDKVEVFHEKLWWRHSPSQVCRIVLDTELLYLCSLVEETFSTDDLWTYYALIEKAVRPSHCGDYTSPDSSCAWSCNLIMPSWQQRTIAAAKVKGVEIV